MTSDASPSIPVSQATGVLRLMEGHAIQTAGVAETEAPGAGKPCRWKSPVSSRQSWELG